MKKRIIPLFLLILALSLLCGCTTYSPPSGRHNMFIVTGSGGGWTIDYDAKTISRGGDRYSYTVKDAGTADPTVTILLPNGVTYYENNHSSGYTGNDDTSKYAFPVSPGEYLMELIRPAYIHQTSGSNRTMTIVSLSLVAVGIILIVIGISAFFVKRR